jgi:hypothetical protein
VTFDARDDKRFQFRLALFIKRGIDAARAFDIAERLWQRDRDLDTRRLCLECKHLRRGWNCAKNEAVLTDVLQRCPLFSWEMPK